MYGHIKSLNSVKKVIKLSKDKKYRKAKIIYCPPFTLLNEFSKLTQNTSINIGAQDCHYNEYHGPYTGSISPNMIKNSGSQYVIVGHSENRFRGDNDSIINKKIISSLRQGLKVIFCIFLI